MTEQIASGEALCLLLAPGRGDLPNHPPWPDVIEIARRNSVAPLLSDAIRKLGLSLPQEYFQDLQRAYYTTAAMNTHLFGVLDRVLEDLTVSGVPVILLKGAALAEAVYGNSALRPMADLDILVPHDLIPEATRLLEALDYETVPGPPGHSFHYQSCFSGEINLRHGSMAGGLVLDVHWHLLPHQWLHHATRLDMDALWGSAQPLTLDNRSSLQLSPEDTLLHLCLHAGYGQAYSHLLNLVDIDRLVHACAPVNWSMLVQRATAFQVRTPVYFGLRFAHDLLGTAVPHPVLAELRPGPLRRWSIEHLADPYQTALRGQTTLPASRQYLLHLALIDGPSGWYRLARFVLWPGDAWLVARYSLQSPAEIRRARLWHPLRALAASLSAVLQPLYRSCGKH